MPTGVSSTDTGWMRRPWLIPLTTLATVGLLGCTLASTGQPARVVSISDGDTIRVQQGQQRLTIRLAYIDAPEMAQRPHNPQAREYLQLRFPISLKMMLMVQTTDRYGRTVAEVVSDININFARSRTARRSPAGSTWGSAMPANTFKQRNEPRAGAMGSGRCPVASPGHATSGVGEDRVGDQQAAR